MTGGNRNTDELLRPVTGSGVDHVLGRQEEHHERHGLDKAEFEPPEDQLASHSADFDHEKERECSSLERMKEGPGQDVERRVPIKPCEYPSVPCAGKYMTGDAGSDRCVMLQYQCSRMPLMK